MGRSVRVLGASVVVVLIAALSVPMVGIAQANHRGGGRFIRQVQPGCLHHAMTKIVEFQPARDETRRRASSSSARRGARSARPRPHPTARCGRRCALRADEEVAGVLELEFRHRLELWPEAIHLLDMTPSSDAVLNQVIAEVETAKSVVEVPSPYAGTVTVLHGEPGQTLEVGKPFISVAPVGSPGAMRTIRRSSPDAA